MSVFIVAESGVNHLGDRAKMLALCDAALAAGADAVKFQAYDTWALMKRRGQLTFSEPTEFDWGRADAVPMKEHRETFNLLIQSQLSDADLDAIAAHCKAIGLKWGCSVFGLDQPRRVMGRGAHFLKIGHAEADWYELHDECLAYDVPCYVSNPPVNRHYERMRPVHCVDEYPADKHAPRLSVIGGHLRPVGFSSHFQDYRIPAAAALRGAEYIEAHLALGAMREGDDIGEDTLGQPEWDWSLQPYQFAAMVKLIREYESWL